MLSHLQPAPYSFQHIDWGSGLQGAITAQIAITAIALSGIERAHWTAAACFIASLIFGVLSVYVSFRVQQELNGLIGSSDIADWLSRPLTRNRKALFNALYVSTQHPAFMPEVAPSKGTAIPPLDRVTELHLGRRASALSAIMIATPAGLLSISLKMLLFGLGIYLGSVYIMDLITDFGKGGSLGIMIFYVLAASFGTFIYSFPQVLKTAEQHTMRESLNGINGELVYLNTYLTQWNQKNQAKQAAGK